MTNPLMQRWAAGCWRFVWSPVFAYRRRCSGRNRSHPVFQPGTGGRGEEETAPRPPFRFMKSGCRVPIRKSRSETPREEFGV
jgi:hypothetical protein